MIYCKGVSQDTIHFRSRKKKYQVARFFFGEALSKMDFWNELKKEKFLWKSCILEIFNKKTFIKLEWVFRDIEVNCEKTLMLMSR